jgi:hypothetical protein
MGPAQAPLPCSTGVPIFNSALLAVFPHLGLGLASRVGVGVERRARSSGCGPHCGCGWCVVWGVEWLRCGVWGVEWEEDRGLVSPKAIAAGYLPSPAAHPLVSESQRYWQGECVWRMGLLAAAAAARSAAGARAPGKRVLFR